MIITVDFDNTLTTQPVQDFIKEVQQLPSSPTIIILTSRLTDETAMKIYGEERATGWNDDVRELASKIGIETVYYTNSVEKYNYCEALHSTIHLDDDKSEISGINLNTKTLGINVKSLNWVQQAYEIINKRHRISTK